MPDSLTAHPDPSPSIGHTFRVSLGTAVSLAGLAALLMEVFVHTKAGQHLDEGISAMLHDPRFFTARGLGRVLNLDLAVMLLVVFMCAIATFRMGLWPRVLIAGFCGYSAFVTVEILKFGIITRPEFGWGDINNFPSGHTAAAVGLALIALWLAPGRYHGLVAAISAWGVATMMDTLFLAQFHRLSEVVASVAIVCGWAAIAALISHIVPRARRLTPAETTMTTKGRPWYESPRGIVVGVTVAFVQVVVLGALPGRSVLGSLVLLVALLTIAVTAIVGVLTIRYFSHR